MRQETMDRLTARQYGLFTRAQALALGLSARKIDGGTGAGRWHRVHRGVYRMTGAPVTELQSVLAAVLAAGPRAAASHRSAAWLWGLTDELRLELSGQRERSPGKGIVMHRTRSGNPRTVLRQGIPCTDPLRTVLDLAATGDEALVGRAVDRGIADGLFSAGAVGAELGRQARRGLHGVTLLRRCLDRRLDDVGERASALESAMDRVIVRHGLPLPHRQFRLRGTRYRLDYAWPDAHVAVEVDGYGSHSGLEAFCDDRARQNAIVLAGWTVLRFTWQDVRRRPAMVAATVEEALRRAAAQAEDKQADQAVRQRLYLDQLAARADLDVLASEAMWR